MNSTLKFFRSIPYKGLLLSPWFLMFLGSALNRLVVAANGGFMPVLIPGGCPTADGILDAIHSCLTPTSHLKILTDWLVYRNEISSIGDWFLDAGYFLNMPFLFAWIACATKDTNALRD